MSVKRLATLVLVLGLISALVPASAMATVGSWDVTGSYGVNVTLDPSPTIYPESLVLAQSGTSITGTYIDFNGGCSFFAIASGSVTGTAVAFAGSNSCGLTIDFVGAIAGSGSMSGTWADEAPGTRAGTWTTTSGTATFVPPTATFELIKHVVPADGSLWNFVITNGNDKTYETYTDKSTTFDSGVLTIDNPTAFEIDEWAGTGTDIADYTPSVACTDNTVPFTPNVTTYYDYGSQHRFYTFFTPAQPGHDYVCTFTNKRIPYAFSGFFAPVGNLPVLNTVKAGQAIPVKFSLGGDQGLDVFWSGYPKSSKIACANSASLDDIEATVTAGASSLSYDSLTQTYNYVWKTDKAWAGTCRQLEVKLADGTSHIAKFQFKK